MTKNILAVVAHPDDEILGVGGTLCKRAGDGDSVYVLILADGESSRDGGGDTGKINARQEAAKRAASILDVREVFFSDFPDNRMDSVVLLDIIKVVEQRISKINPDVIYTHHGGDLNVDHRLTFEAVMTASRPIQGGSYPKEIYGFETLSSTEWGVHGGFEPSVYIDIEDVFDKKLAALKVYESEMRPFPHPRSYDAVEALAKLRGSTVALNRAEAFACLRNIKD